MSGSKLNITCGCECYTPSNRQEVCQFLSSAKCQCYISFSGTAGGRVKYVPIIWFKEREMVSIGVGRYFFGWRKWSVRASSREVERESGRRPVRELVVTLSTLSGWGVLVDTVRLTTESQGSCAINQPASLPPSVSNCVCVHASFVCEWESHQHKIKVQMWASFYDYT